MQQQQVVQQQAAMYNDGYGNYIPNAPAPPQFGAIDQMSSQYGYDFQGSTGFVAPTPNFGGIDCPAPPGLAEGWIPPPQIQPEESEEERLKREGN